VQGFVRAPYNDIEAISNIARNNNDIVAIMVEPIQGESGIRIPAADYLNQLRALCDEHHWLLILDEIQTGMARTGAWFAFQHNGIKPDVMTLAKSLGNGVPIGACLALEKAASLMKPGSHGSTFGGNPLACAAALAVIETIEQDELLRNAQTQGDYLLARLRAQLDGIEGVTEVRGKGLMIGIELDRPCSELVAQALQQGLLFSVQSNTTIRLLPPLIFNQQQCDTVVEIVSTLVINHLQQQAA
jgi:acetylornithine aminotransferase